MLRTFLPRSHRSGHLPSLSTLTFRTMRAWMSSLLTPHPTRRPPLTPYSQSGVVLTGLPAYKRMFATFRFARKTLVHDLSTAFRISYDGSRQQVSCAAGRS